MPVDFRTEFNKISEIYIKDKCTFKDVIDISVALAISAIVSAPFSVEEKLSNLKKIQKTMWEKGKIQIMKEEEMNKKLYERKKIRTDSKPTNTKK